MLHVGTPKSGTTYLQDLMWDRRAELLEAGVCYPGDRPDAHFLASQELKDGQYQGWQEPAVVGAWGRLVEAARAHPGTTVISHELFGDLTAERAARAIDDLDFTEVHIVVTARDLARQLPAVWQEDLKHRHHLPFTDLVDIVRPGSDRADVLRPAGPIPEGHAEAFWLRQDVAAVLRRWGAERLPADRVHLVTVPPRGSDTTLLWQRFTAVLGIDPGVVPAHDRPRNTSLGHVEAELLRRLNERLDYGVDWPLYGPRVTHLLAPVLAGRSGTVPLRLPAGADWVPAHSRTMVAELRTLGCSVVGDLEELLVAPSDTRAVPEPTATDLLDAALDAITALIPGMAPPVTAVPVELEAPVEPVPNLIAPDQQRVWPSFLRRQRSRPWTRPGSESTSTASGAAVTLDADEGRRVVH